ncbi:helix-turn-helix transcriptional regulator [Rhodococcus triatomae]|uniref:DNA-binding transcriptional regulator, HxlR family n=1 Tax=Rhodococcus triatomae TaxID=300028 RepID=A0A1G8HPS9_9NOCA|nr:helix-turn-helix domain-containing protein [Rhodococcus triatomae]QNG20846.1 helix-turn-helix transcriptional regulator [Rhodococcus triatomae]QNG23239.1 helix-turn-helix transcriptional regulator [Rhodococcus triatomae]SDI08663.1 DNA-binding transcriptional regulator, HxlR family [Rhodococcus triatomae]
MVTQSAQQRRELERQAYDAFMAACPSRMLLERIGDKWVGLVLSALTDGPLRYGELRRHIAGVSQKMLTQTLRNLESDGLVTRTVTAEVPVRVDYELTPLGRSLRDVLAQVKQWAEEHIPEILESRERHASRTG